MQTQDFLFKICLFGDGGVGKTTLINKYLKNAFIEDSKMTIGVDFRLKKFKMNENRIILQIWDFAGEDRFRFLLPNYMNGASGGIFMYDITRYSSLKNINEWLEVLRIDHHKGEDKIPILLVGGKADLEEKRAVDYKDAYELAKSFNFSGLIECSSKTGENIENIFQLITRLMLEKMGFSNSNIFKQIEENTQKKSIILFD